MQRNELVNWANSLGFDPTTIPNDSKLEAHLKYLQNSGTAFTGTLGTQTLTTTDVFTDGEVVTVGSVTYTMVDALSETKASSTLTSDATNVAEGETVTIDGITYTFRASPVNPYDVDIGASAAVSLDNLKAAINDSGTEGTTYGTGTEAHPTVTAEANADTTQEVTAKRFGTYANGFITVETSAHLAWDDATLGGASATPGVNPVANEVLIGASAAASLDNFKSAVNATAGEGTTYSTGTRAHPQVTATTNANDSQIVEARDYSVTNASIATTTDAANATWGSTTLASGVRDVNAVNAATVAQTGSGRNMNV